MKYNFKYISNTFIYLVSTFTYGAFHRLSVELMLQIIHQAVCLSIWSVSFQLMKANVLLHLVGEGIKVLSLISTLCMLVNAWTVMPESNPAIRALNDCHFRVFPLQLVREACGIENTHQCFPHDVVSVLNPLSPY